ncbi:MAG: hypothetical protein IPH86_13790 [bacterium]|nr:hypothetical protein [bacterium]
MMMNILQCSCRRPRWAPVKGAVTTGDQLPEQSPAVGDPVSPGHSPGAVLTFATMQDEFAHYNTKLVGLSVDGLSAIAWCADRKDLGARTSKSPSPDRGHLDGRARYGMIQPGEAPESRAPGRAPLLPASGELQACALQAADAFGVATPADWRPGDDVIVPPPAPAAWPRTAWTARRTSPATTGSSARRRSTRTR